jgi:hypothetical protein
VAYHSFADQRLLLGIPGALTGLSNLPFPFVSVAGLLFVWREPPYPAGPHFISSTERWPWLISFLGVARAPREASGILVAFVWYGLAKLFEEFDRGTRELTRRMVTRLSHLMRSYGFQTWAWDELALRGVVGEVAQEHARLGHR